MKQHKQMLSASIIDEDEDIFPKIIETNEEIADPIILINKKREREDLKELKVKKSKFEPLLPPETKVLNTPLINNVMSSKIINNPPIRAMNCNQSYNYPYYYNNNIQTNPKISYNYNYLPTQISNGMNNNTGFYHGVQHSNHMYNNYNHNYLQNNLNSHSYNNQYLNGTLIHGQNPAAASFIQQNLSKEKVFSIKNIPETTVGGFLQNKEMQTKYLSYIKPKIKEDHALTSNNLIKNEETSESRTTDLSLAKTSQGFPPNSTYFSSAPSSNYSTMNNYHISNQNSLIGNLPQNQSIIYTNNNIQMIHNTAKPEAVNSYIRPTNATKSIPANLEELNYQMNVNLANSNSIDRSIYSNPEVINKKVEKSLKDNNSAAQDLPDSLKLYIEKSFAKCRTEDERKKCEGILQKIITVTQKNDQLFTMNWDKFPLPQLPWEIDENKNKKSITLVKNVQSSHQELKKRDFRKGRFYLQENEGEAIYNNLSPVREAKKSQNREITLEEIENTHTIIGTCTDLEKQYLRLTTIPNPSNVRPEHILKKSLKMLKKKWKNNDADYNYISEQFRSIRQDMIIQHMKNDFTLKVYETHARMALERHDLDQFNQCQTQLVLLYADGHKGKEVEFLAYRIIYLALQDIKYEIVDLLREVKTSLRSVPEIKHSLNLRKALNETNYFEFFKLYKIAPNMGSYLIEPFLNRYRMKALQVFAVGYFTETSLDFVCEKLAFQSKDDCINFMEENKIILCNNKSTIRCKESLSSINSSNYIIINNPTLSSEKIV